MVGYRAAMRASPSVAPGDTAFRLLVRCGSPSSQTWSYSLGRKELPHAKSSQSGTTPGLKDTPRKSDSSMPQHIGKQKLLKGWIVLDGSLGNLCEQILIFRELFPTLVAKSIQQPSKETDTVGNSGKNRATSKFNETLNDVHFV